MIKMSRPMRVATYCAARCRPKISFLIDIDDGTEIGARKAGSLCERQW
jgi:hypothetical protein